MGEAFWSWQLVLALVLNAIVQAITIGAYAARLAGVLSTRIATSISLFNLFVTASRIANLFYAPLLGTLADHAAKVLSAKGVTAAVSSAAASTLVGQIRLIVLAGTIGTVLGALLLPTFITLFLRGIRAFERTGSLPHAILRLGDPRVIFSLGASLRRPTPGLMRRFSLKSVPLKLLFFNVIVTAVYAVGVVAAFYASILDVQARATAIALSGIINGIATISFTLVVDPTSAFITDQAVRGERSVEDVKSMVFYLALTAIVGTLVSQLILVPAAHVIATVAHWYAK